jgi:hypothetical protein
MTYKRRPRPQAYVVQLIFGLVLAPPRVIHHLVKLHHCRPQLSVALPLGVALSENFVEALSICP